MKYLILALLFTSCSHKSWREASRESIGIAPKPIELTESIFQVYYARAFSWRGWFGIHPWIAWKKKNEKQYTVAQVTAWNLRRAPTAVSQIKDLPDRKWFDSPPTILFEVRGNKADAIIKKIPQLIKNYPYKETYRVWPGPNSNTFVSYILRNVDEIQIELPSHAVGKDYQEWGDFLQESETGTGFSVTLGGLLGFNMAYKEGLEFNLFGLHLGLDLWTPALKVPFVGRLGFPDRS